MHYTEATIPFAEDLYDRDTAPNNSLIYSPTSREERRVELKIMKNFDPENNRPENFFVVRRFYGRPVDCYEIISKDHKRLVINHDENGIKKTYDIKARTLLNAFIKEGARVINQEKPSQLSLHIEEHDVAEQLRGQLCGKGEFLRVHVISKNVDELGRFAELYKAKQYTLEYNGTLNYLECTECPTWSRSIETTENLAACESLELINCTLPYETWIHLKVKKLQTNRPSNGLYVEFNDIKRLIEWNKELEYVSAHLESGDQCSVLKFIENMKKLHNMREFHDGSANYYPDKDEEKPYRCLISESGITLIYSWSNDGIQLEYRAPKLKQNNMAAQ